MFAVFAAKSRPPPPACLHFIVYHIPRSPPPLPIISRSPGWLDAHYFSYNNIPSYSVSPNLSFRMHTINISKRERSQSTHKVPKRGRLAPSWDVVDDHPPHQLVDGDTFGNKSTSSWAVCWHLAQWRVLFKDTINTCVLKRWIFRLLNNNTCGF